MIDPQDPLPEGTFLYRRIFSYALASALVALLALVIWQMQDAASLRQVALYLCLMLFVVTTYYMVAPSAEHVVKTIQTVRLFSSPHCPPQLTQAARHNPTHEEPDEPVDAAPRGRA